MKIIPLTDGKASIVDDEDYEFLTQWKWHHNQNRAVRRLAAKFGRKVVLMHRIILNAPDDLLVDHIDGNGLNNQKINLRICNKAQNAQNQRIGSRNKTGVKGAFFCLRSKKYQAVIIANRKTHLLGLFDLLEDAKKAYNDAAPIFHGEFARPNP